jgi:uncharacterized DUF497 family protein
VEFGWDARKARTNAAKHGVTFEAAITAFDDPFALVALDAAHSTAAEERRWLIGEADRGVVVVVFTVRQPNDVHRIISARPASRKERRRYDESKGVPF